VNLDSQQAFDIFSDMFPLVTNQTSRTEVQNLKIRNHSLINSKKVVLRHYSHRYSLAQMDKI